MKLTKKEFLKDFPNLSKGDLICTLKNIKKISKDEFNLYYSNYKKNDLKEEILENLED